MSAAWSRGRSRVLGRGSGVFNVAGQYYALRNLCPHKLGPLCVGRVSGRPVAAAPPSSYLGEPEIVRDGEVLRCPWHLWEFAITTGQCLVDPQMRVKMYPVAIEDGQVVVYADRADLPVPSPAHSRALVESGVAEEVEES